ncbi:MAG: 50S ribosomal protein L9 [Patescibacteria group bacterium]
MKVILIKDTPNVGNKNDVKEVSPGHAQNFLFPGGYATLATPVLIAQAEVRKHREEEGHKIKEDLLLKNLASLAEVRLELTGKANGKGHLFAGIHKETLVEELKKQTHLDIYPDFINLKHPLKEVGEHDVEVTAHGKTAKFKVIVNAI